MVKVCCPVMESFLYGKHYACVPHLNGGCIAGCDETFDKDFGGEPIRFCPWCGKAVVKEENDGPS